MSATPRLLLRRCVLPALTATALSLSTLLAGPAGAAHFPSADEATVDAAASYVAARLNDAGLVTIGGGSVTPEGVTVVHEAVAYGFVLEIALALLAAGSRAQQQDDGSFLQLDNGMFPGPRPPVDITGPAVLGLNAVGEPTGDAVVWLTAQQNDDGGLHSAEGVTDGSSNAGSTALALPALAGSTYQHSARFVARQAVPVPPSSPTTPPPTPRRHPHRAGRRRRRPRCRRRPRSCRSPASTARTSCSAELPSWPQAACSSPPPVRAGADGTQPDLDRRPGCPTPGCTSEGHQEIDARPAARVRRQPPHDLRPGGRPALRYAGAG